MNIIIDLIGKLNLFILLSLLQLFIEIENYLKSDICIISHKLLVTKKTKDTEKNRTRKNRKIMYFKKVWYILLIN